MSSLLLECGCCCSSQEENTQSRLLLPSAMIISSSALLLSFSCVFNCSHTVLFLFPPAKLLKWFRDTCWDQMFSVLKFVASNNRPGPEVGILFIFRLTHSCLYLFSSLIFLVASRSCLLFDFHGSFVPFCNRPLLWMVSLGLLKWCSSLITFRSPVFYLLASCNCSQIRNNTPGQVCVHPLGGQNWTNFSWFLKGQRAPGTFRLAVLDFCS